MASIKHLDQLMSLETKVFATDTFTRRSIKRFIERGNVIVALKNNEVLGSVISLKRKDSKVTRIYSLAVDPDYHDKGIGSRLLKAVENMSTEIRLEVREDNHHAISFYTRHGYKVFGRIRNYYKDGATALRMHKER